METERLCTNQSITLAGRLAHITSNVNVSSAPRQHQESTGEMIENYRNAIRYRIEARDMECQEDSDRAISFLGSILSSYEERISRTDETNSA